jgi:hypothetical protein
MDFMRRGLARAGPNLWDMSVTTIGGDAKFLSVIIKWNPVKKTETNDRGDPLRWPRNTLYPQKLILLRQQAAVARSA